MCDDIILEDIHLPSVAGIDDIICTDLTDVNINPGVYEICVLGFMI